MGKATIGRQRMPELDRVLGRHNSECAARGKYSRCVAQLHQRRSCASTSDELTRNAAHTGVLRVSWACTARQVCGAVERCDAVGRYDAACSSATDVAHQEGVIQVWGTVE